MTWSVAQATWVTPGSRRSLSKIEIKPPTAATSWSLGPRREGIAV